VSANLLLVLFYKCTAQSDNIQKKAEQFIQGSHYLILLFVLHHFTFHNTMTNSVPPSSLPAPVAPTTTVVAAPSTGSTPAVVVAVPAESLTSPATSKVTSATQTQWKLPDGIEKQIENGMYR
jgi:hypothetical protein